MSRFRIARIAAVSLVGALLAVSLPSCGTRAALDGTSWDLVAWPVSDLDPGDFTITAEFADGRVGGTSAVNHYGGAYRTGPGNTFSVGEIEQTLMAGPEPAMRAEAAYIELLRSAESYRLNGTTLTLFDGSGAESLVFETAAW